MLFSHASSARMNSVCGNRLTQESCQSIRLWLICCRDFATHTFFRLWSYRASLRNTSISRCRRSSERGCDETLGFEEMQPCRTCDRSWLLSAVTAVSFNTILGCLYGIVPECIHNPAQTALGRFHYKTRPSSVAPHLAFRTSPNS